MGGEAEGVMLVLIYGLHFAPKQTNIFMNQCNLVTTKESSVFIGTRVKYFCGIVSEYRKILSDKEPWVDILNDKVLHEKTD